VVIDAPVGCGFRKLHGKVYYLPLHHRLRVEVMAERLPTNKGPAFGYSDTVPWVKRGQDHVGMRKHLEAKMRTIARKLTSRDPTLLEKKVQLKRCNVTGMDNTVFMNTVCVECACWYCELSDG